MIVIAGALFGAIAGGTIAARRKGNRADIAQYATVYAIAFSILGLIATVVLEKALV
jgi:hypothetical protein